MNKEKIEILQLYISVTVKPMVEELCNDLSRERWDGETWQCMNTQIPVLIHLRSPEAGSYVCELANPFPVIGEGTTPLEAMYDAQLKLDELV